MRGAKYLAVGCGYWVALKNGLVDPDSARPLALGLAQSNGRDTPDVAEEFACETITNFGVEKDFEASFVTSLIPPCLVNDLGLDIEVGKTLVRYIVS